MSAKMPKFLACKYWTLLFLFCVSLTSCLSHKELINFRTGEEANPILPTLAKQEIGNQVELKLQANDILGIVITSPDGGSVLSSPYNLVTPQMAGQLISTTSPATFIISSDGFIDVPSLGRLKAAGLSVKEVRDEIFKLVSKEIVNPSVNVRLMNFKISVMGEVTQPGSFSVESERITILEALARAGDITPFGNRRHVMIVRERNGVREFSEIDLKSTDMFKSPYFYLQQNDYIYVEPTKGKIAQLQQPVNTYLQPIVTGVGILITAISLIIQATK